MENPQKPSENQAESNPTESQEDIEQYKALLSKQKAEYDALKAELDKLKDFKHSVEKAQRKQLEEDVKTYFPDLEITSKHSSSYLEGLLEAARKYHVSEKDTSLRIPDQGQPVDEGTPRLDKEQKLIKKLLDG